MGRLGRVLHWLLVALGALLAIGAIAMPPTTADGAADYSQAPELLVGAAVMAMAGRGLRYILSGE